ncbi:MAG: ketopantoate reductase family protein [Candidatus Omnitrophica bacterium]|nr:ketopantoate reductase family protein [Candidatus Omnitrophota bacterium]
MKIAVVGAGAIGCLVAGYLKLKGEDVVLVGRPELALAIGKLGLSISGVRGNFNVNIKASTQLDYEPELLILATKTQDIQQALEASRDFIKGATILTIQNGIRAEEIISRFVDRKNIVSSIVMFGSTYLEPGKVVHNFEGSWIIGKMFNGRPDENLIFLSLLLDKAFPTIISENLKGMKYLKIFVNANNCIPAILGLSMQESFSDLDVARISIAVWKEGFELISQAGIELVSLPDFPVENITKLTSIPSSEAAKIFSGIMTKLSKDPLYGSILQSIKRGRASEIDYINGEFVNLAKDNNLLAPLNERLAGLVHKVEQERKFLNKEELIEATKEFLD